LAAAIKAETGIEAELIRGGGGVFDVTVDGERIFSKQSRGRFPEAHEILDRLRG
jgi:selT/selW/selH-like putative selenoprotein